MGRYRLVSCPVFQVFVARRVGLFTLLSFRLGVLSKVLFVLDEYVHSLTGSCSVVAADDNPGDSLGVSAILARFLTPKVSPFQLRFLATPLHPLYRPSFVSLSLLCISVPIPCLSPTKLSSVFDSNLVASGMRTFFFFPDVHDPPFLPQALPRLWLTATESIPRARTWRWTEKTRPMRTTRERTVTGPQRRAGMTQTARRKVRRNSDSLEIRFKLDLLKGLIYNLKFGLPACAAPFTSVLQACALTTVGARLVVYH